MPQKISYIGKGSKWPKDAESRDEVREAYQDSRRDPFRQYPAPIPKLITCAEVMRQTGGKERHIIAIRNGYRNLSVTLRKALIEVAADYPRKLLPDAVVGQI